MKNRIWFAWIAMLAACGGGSGEPLGPVTLSAEFTRSGPTEVQVAAVRGRIHVAWTQRQSGGVRVRSSLDGGTTFGPDLRLDSGAGDVEQTRICADGTSVHVAWVKVDGSQDDVYVASSTDAGETFGAPKRIDSSDSPSGIEVQDLMIRCGEGSVYVSWTEDKQAPNQTRRQMYTANSEDDGATFNGPLVSGISATDFTLGGISGRGASFAEIFAINTGAIRATFKGYSTNHGNFFSLIRVGEGPNRDRVDMPRLARAGTTVHFFWVEEEAGGNRLIRTARSDDFGVTLGEPRTVPSDVSGPAGRLLTCADGNFVHVLWVASDGTLRYQGSGDAGATWRPKDLQVAAQANPIALSCEGAVADAVWIGTTSERRLLHARIQGGTLEGPDTISGDRVAGWSPAVARSDGKAHVLWEDQTEDEIVYWRSAR